MAREQSERTRRGGAEAGREDGDRSEREIEDDATAPGGAVPEMIRRAMAMGLSGFFMTEGAIRRALGDTVPKDWVDFAASQSERTRSELIDRLGDELGQVLQNLDVEQLFEELLAGRTIEIDARIRFAGKDDEPRRRGAAEDGARESRASSGKISISNPKKKRGA